MVWLSFDRWNPINDRLRFSPSLTVTTNNSLGLKAEQYEEIHSFDPKICRMSPRSDTDKKCVLFKSRVLLRHSRSHDFFIVEICKIIVEC